MKIKCYTGIRDYVGVRKYVGIKEYVGVKDMMLNFSGAYRRRWTRSVVRFFAPFPGDRHVRPGNGLNSPPDLGLGQLAGRHPSGIMTATHVAYLVSPALEWRYPAANECRQEIVGRHSFLIELGDNLVNLVDFLDKFLRIKPPIELLHGRADNEFRQAYHINPGHVLHIEERPKPFPA